MDDPWCQQSLSEGGSRDAPWDPVGVKVKASEWDTMWDDGVEDEENVKQQQWERWKTLQDRWKKDLKMAKGLVKCTLNG